MKFTCCTIVFLLAAIPLCFGQDGLKTLLERIEAVEAKDIEQSARIKQLETQVQNSNYKLHHMSALNQDLHAEHATLIQKLADQEVTIATLKTDLLNKKLISDKSSQQIAVLESTVTEMDATISMLKRTFARSKNSFKDQPYNLKSTKYNKELNQNNIKENQDSKGLFHGNSPNNGLKIQSFDESKRNSTIVYTNKSETNSHQSSMLSFFRKNGDDTRQSKRTKELKTRQTDHTVIISKQRATTNYVAFHAVISTHKVANLGRNDNIRFDTVLLNEGAGYHNQHGLFIVPKSGFYVFTVTLATAYELSFYAELRKNGVRLASLSGDGEPIGFLDQSSVTIVTKLNTGDEVWVVHTDPANGSIWGNYYSSFAGFLLTEFE